MTEPTDSPTPTPAAPDARTCNTLIESLGVYLPPRAVSTRDIMRACQNTVLYPLERLTGIKFRRMAGEVEFAIDLARQAVAACLERSRYRAADVQLLICCNISRYDGPNFEFSFEPSTSARLKKHFGMTNAICFDISNACAGMFTGVNIADSFLKAGMVDNALVVSGEYITHLTEAAQKEIDGREDLRMACLTLGDSGAAAMLERTPDANLGWQKVDMYTLGRYSDLCIAKPTDREHGGAIMLTQGLKIHAVAIREVAKHIGHMIRGTHWSLHRMHYLIQHQTARTAIHELARELNDVYQQEFYNRTNMINNLAERGNTSSTTHFVAIWDNIFNKRLRAGDDVVFAVMASGVTIGTAPYTFDDLPERLRQLEDSAKPRAKNATPVAAPRPPQTRVRIESVAVSPPDQHPHESVELVAGAAEICLDQSAYDRKDIDILIFPGIHRTDFICEPAIAALITGRLDMNAALFDPEQPKTFAFDILNGAGGTMNALQTATAMIRSGKFRRVMIASSELENNADMAAEHHLGIEEIGTAMIVDASPDGRVGFSEIVCRYFTEHLDAFRSHIGQENGHSFLIWQRHPDLLRLYRECIAKTVPDLLARENLQRDAIDIVLAPQISAAFVEQLALDLKIPADRFVVCPGKDYYTNSVPAAFAKAQADGRVEPGNVGLVIGVGTGIQVACAAYYF